MSLVASAPISLDGTVDIGGGRGRLAPNPAASLARIDAQLGRLADVNDAWRSPNVADENSRKWLAYQNGTGPIAPYALDRWGSIHCRGYATDSDDWYDPAAAAIWRRNGWRQTALYPVGDSRREPWHGEYDEALDQHLGQPAVTATGNLPIPEGNSTMFIIHNASNPSQLVLVTADAGQLRARYLEDPYERAVFLAVRPAIPTAPCDDPTFAGFLERLGYRYQADIPLIDVFAANRQL